jgi:hypothetical protein
MFPIHYSLDQRKIRLEDLLSRGEHAIAIVVVAAELERTTRRTIIALGEKFPTKTIRTSLEKKYNSIGKYEQAWKYFVESSGHASFATLFPEFPEIRKAFSDRNELIHGKRGTAGKEYSRRRIELIFSMIIKLTELAAANQIDLTERLKVRRLEK